MNDPPGAAPGRLIERDSTDRSSGPGSSNAPPRSAAPPRGRWQVNAVLFVATVASVFLMGAFSNPPEAADTWLGWYLTGWTFAVPLMSILVVHELGHYVAARIHRVDASLPYFLPLPLISPFGTLGAVIAMRQQITNRNALLDIGAAGPLAGMVVAVPVLWIGLVESPVNAVSTENYIQEGQSLLYLAMKRIAVGPIPDGHDVFLHPTALAGWVGLLITMLNLLPWGQLDGGHVAYALFGERQHRFAYWVRLSLLPLFALNLAMFVIPVVRGTSDLPIGLALSNSATWLVLYVVLGILSRATGGPNHPPTAPGQLTNGRRWVAAITLALFILLFMPTPLAQY